MIIEKSCEQGSPEWMALLLANPGASSMDQIVTSTGAKSGQRQKYMYKMVCELITGKKHGSYKNEDMERGTELEHEARELFEFLHGPVEQCAMIYQDERKLWHISPDGIMPEQKAGLEIKCPSLPVHIEYLDKGKLPTEYKVQVQASMMVTGWYDWWFVSYYPGWKPLIIKVERDESLIKIINSEVESFCIEMRKLAYRLK